MLTRSSRLFAFTLLLLYAISIVGWHVYDNRPSSMDETRHMKLSLDYGAWMGRGVPLTNEWSHVYPPFYHLSILPAVALGIPSEGKVAATHLLYLLIFIAGCLMLGRSMKRPDVESLLGAFLCAGYCYVIWASRRALIDFPLMAWVTFSMALLFRTDGFSSKKASLLWALSVGAGLLIKPPFAFFSFGPVLWVLLTGLHQDHRARGERLKNFLLAAGLCLAIALPWYFWQGAYFIDKASRLALEPQGVGTNPHTLAGWFFYARILTDQIGLPSLIFTLIGIALACVRRLRQSSFLLVWFVSGYLILSALVNKDYRHSLSLMPALALLAAQGWGTLFSEGLPLTLLAFAGPLLMIFNFWTYDRPAREDWKHDQILEYVAQHHSSIEPFLAVSVLSHHPRFFSRTLKWSAIRKGIDLSPVSAGDSNTSFAEFILTRPGDQGGETLYMERQWQDLKPTTRAFTSLFTVGARYPFPDKSEVIIYQRNPHPHFNVDGLSPRALEQRIAQALGIWVQGPLKVSVQATSEGLREGRLDHVSISCSGCSIKGVPVKNVQVVIEKPWLNLYRLWDEKHLGLLGFESLKPSLAVSASDVKGKLAEVKGLTDADVEMTGGHLTVMGRFKGIPVKAVVHVFIDPAGYAHADAILDRIYIGGVPLPGWILGKAHHQVLPLYPIPDFPGRILIDGVMIDNGQLQVN